MVYEGRGASVIDVKVDASQIIVDATHAGRSNFIVKPITGGGEAGSSIVNEIGNYSGRVLITEPNKLVALQINADGAWSFTFDTLAAARVATPAAPFEGTGDDVVLVRDLPTSGLIRVSFTAGDSNFIVRPFDKNARRGSSLVNETGPWQGTVVLKNDTALLEVLATGPWTMNIQK